MKRALSYLFPLAAVVALVALWQFVAVHIAGTLAGVAAAGMFGPLLGLKAKTYERLVSDTKAISPEFFPMTWYDSATYTGGTTVGAVNFFAQTNADISLSNMQLAGQFPADEFFDIGEIHVDVLERVATQTAGAAASAAVGALDDLMQIMLTGRTLISLNLRNKLYGPVPVAQTRPLGAVGGPSTSGAYAATTSVQFPGKWDGCGWIFEKTVTIGPTTKFGVTVQFPPVAMTLSVATVIVRVSLRGVHYRLVA